MGKKSLEEIKKILKENKEDLKRRFKIKEIGIFGSFAHNLQKEESDVDILVEFEEVPSLLKFIHIENYLSELLGIKVDLVTKKALKPYIGEIILKEVIFVWKEK